MRSSSALCALFALCSVSAAPLFDEAYVRARIISTEALTRGRSEMPVVARPITDSLPAAFDARTEWSNCTSISDIYDQGACGDCWAVGAITAATDRLCIAGQKAGNGAAVGNPRLSVEHIVGCCKVCGYGCADGFPNYAWNWLAGKKGEPYGVVTGGQYGDTSFCSAYTLPPCNHYATPNDTLRNCESGPPDKTPACPATCDNNTSYKTPFAQDVHKFASAYAVPSAEASIMQEIFEHGPVTTGFNVYSDWIHYRSGVYRATGGTEMGGHAVRIIGWGVEGGDKYWLVANSFGRKWGDQGYFKILKGVGMCGIENAVVAGLP